eukprot:10354-Amphidinium_carterae.1
MLDQPLLLPHDRMTSLASERLQDPGKRSNAFCRQATEDKLNCSLGVFTPSTFNCTRKSQSLSSNTQILTIAERSYYLREFKQLLEVRDTNRHGMQFVSFPDQQTELTWFRARAQTHCNIDYDSEHGIEQAQ